MEEWEKDIMAGFLKVPEGAHELEVLGAPTEDVSKYSGKKQWCFPAIMDGQEGKLTPPKALGKIIVSLHKAKGAWPIKFKFTREGMGTKDTQIRLVS